jgi:hypothetical protein
MRGAALQLARSDEILMLFFGELGFLSVYVVELKMEVVDKGGLWAWLLLSWVVWKVESKFLGRA